MKGGIYSNQHCPACGKTFKHFDPRGLWCTDHPGHMATRFVVRFGKITRNFGSYERAYRFLTGIRYKNDEGSFDPRDYQSSRPLGFANLVEKFLHAKRHLKGVKKYEQRLRFGVKRFANTNIKLIEYGHLEDLANDLRDQGKSPKYIYDIICCLRMFFTWADRREKTGIPEFPEVKPLMGLRKILTKQRQRDVLEEVRRLSWAFNPKIYMAISFLATYINVRPAELLSIREADIDHDAGRCLIRSTKEGPPKYLHLLDEDAALLRETGGGFARLHVFCHLKGHGGARPGMKFTTEYLGKWWSRACRNLGVEGVSLYPGTRHSTVVDLRRRHSPEAIRRATGHRSSQAFNRYLQVTGDELKALYQDTRLNNALITDFSSLHGKNNKDSR